MNVKSYDQIIDSYTSEFLKQECKQIEEYGLVGNHWVGLYDEPQNSLEKYVQDSFDFYLADQFPNAIGFEWWFHTYYDDDRFLPFHVDCDEYLRKNDSRYVLPLISTVTYLNAHHSPTIVLNMAQFGEDLMQFEPRKPTEVTYSVPGEGKFFTFDSRYVHGVLEGNLERYTLMYNVWHYRPETLMRSNYRSVVKNSQFFKCDPEEPSLYLGQTRCPLQTRYNGVEFQLKVPKAMNFHQTWIVKS